MDHSILLSKLNHYGIRGPVNEWFSSYLNDKQISSKRNVLTVVPQGSVLGPLLFLIYINDIYNSSKKLSFYLFADDTNLLYADKDLKSLESAINIELQKVCDWLNANKLTINAKKSNFVIFRPSQKKLSYQIKIRTYSLVILKLDLELIATDSPFAPNNYLSDPNKHIKSLPKSTRRKIVNLPEHFQLICIISKGLLVCVFWKVKKRS